MVFCQAVIGLFLNYPPLIFVFMGSVLLIMLGVSLLLKTGKETYGKILFLSASYIVIFFLTPVFGYDLNTHLFLIPGVGMALIFFDQEIGNRKWFFVLAGFPVWIAIELWAKHWPVVVQLPDNLTEQMGLVNIGFTMITSFFMYYVFTERSNRQLKEINVQKKHAENSIERLTQFNYLLTHDLKSPLGNISTLTELLAKEDSITLEEMKEVMAKLNEKAHGSLRLVEGITDYFKNTQKQDPEWQDTASIVSEVLSLLEIESSFKIKVGTLPQVFLSKIALRQIVQNIVTNAIKYNDKEKGTLHIYYEQNAEHGKLCFEDNGVGMNARQQKKAFELHTLFHKMAKGHSSGMGLAIVKELVESNDGFVELQSEVGVGTQFNLCFTKTKFKTAKK